MKHGWIRTFPSRRFFLELGKEMKNRNYYEDKQLKYISETFLGRQNSLNKERDMKEQLDDNIER